MKTIKFRAWDGEQIVSPDYVDRNGLAWWKENSIPTYSETVHQFTGLTDVNGKEIFEGDVLTPTAKREVNGARLKNKPNNKDKTVIFHEGAFKISSGPDKGRYSLTGLMIRTMGYTVTGNIYEKLRRLV